MWAPDCSGLDVLGAVRARIAILIGVLVVSGTEGEPGTLMCQAATAVRWLSTAAILFQPLIRRNLICPLATRLKSRIRAVARMLGTHHTVVARAVAIA